MFPLSFLLPLTLSHYVLYQQSPIPILFFSRNLPPLSMSLLMQSLSQFRPSFPLHYLGSYSRCQLFIYHSFQMTGPFQPAPHQCLLKTFLQSKSNIHSHFIRSSLISSHNSHDSSYRVVFRKPGPSVVSLLVPSSLVLSCVPG